MGSLKDAHTDSLARSRSGTSTSGRDWWAKGIPVEVRGPGCAGVQRAEDLHDLGIPW